MKADISKDGTLTITAENGTESFALRTWFGVGTDRAHGGLAVDIDSFEKPITMIGERDR